MEFSNHLRVSGLKFIKTVLYGLNLDKIQTLHVVYKFLESNIMPSKIKVNGLILFLDKNDRVVSTELALTNKWEEYETKVFKDNLKEGMNVLDIGAHIGYYTLLASKIVGNKGKVYAFEPDRKNFSFLSKNIRANNVKNILTVNKAVSDTMRDIEFFLSEENKGDHRIYDSGEGRHKVKVKCTTLDSYFKNIKANIDVIKMDIQGAELKALRGSRNLLKKNKNIKIFIEYWPKGLKMSGDSGKELLDFLEKEKFSFYKINDVKEKCEKITTVQLLKQYSEKTMKNTNLLCVRE